MEKVSSLLNRKWNEMKYKTTEYFKSVANGKLLPKRTNSNSIWNARTRFKEFLRTLSAPWVNKLQFYNFFCQYGYILSHWRGLIVHDSSLFYWVSSRINSFSWCRTAQRRDYNGIGEFPLLLRMVCSLFSYFPIFTVSLREFQLTYFLIWDREAQAS